MARRGFAVNARCRVDTRAWPGAAGDIQVFRNALETVYVFPRVGPVDRKGELVAAGDPTEQVKQALGNLRLLASRIGVLPAHFVTVTVYGADNSLRESLEKSAREVFSDWGPASAFVEAIKPTPAGRNGGSRSGCRSQRIETQGQ